MANEKIDDLLSSIESNNIEEVSGVQLNENGSYALKQSKTTRELMAMVWQWWNLVQTLKKSSNNYQESLLETKQESENNTIVIDATLVAKHAFDKFGRAIARGMTCPICGRKIKNLGMGGYCSAECVLKDAKNKVASYLLSPNDKYKDFQKCIEDLEKILDQTILLINAVAMIPDILSELASFPIAYREFVQQKITEGFCELRMLIAEAMIKKNELLKQIMRSAALGIVIKPIAFMFATIQSVQNAMIIAQEAFDKAYGIAMQAITSLSLPTGPNLTLKAGSFGWLCTPRSFISPLPYTAPSMSKIIVDLPGGSGMQSLSLVKPTCPSALEDIDFSSIEDIIQAAFPPLTPLDYYLEPELFEVRYLFSDQSDLVAQIRQQLTDLLRGGPDYIPAFENLFPIKRYTNMAVNGETKPEIYLPNIGYIWFLLGLMDAWAPQSQSLVGSLLNPAL